MQKIYHGIAHGKMIELDEELELAEGQKVEVSVHVVPEKQAWGEGLRRCAGALADDPEWDSIMEQIEQSRKLERRLQEEA